MGCKGISVKNVTMEYVRGNYFYCGICVSKACKRFLLLWNMWAESGKKITYSCYGLIVRQPGSFFKDLAVRYPMARGMVSLPQVSVFCLHSAMGIGPMNSISALQLYYEYYP